MGQRSSVYLADDLAAAVKASGQSLAELVRRGLTARTAEVAPPPENTLITSSPLAALPDGEPSRGVLCAGPGCWERSTSKYGLRQVPLCPACRAALEGHVYQREIPASAARIMRRGAA